MTEILTPLKAIRKKCLDCSCWNTAEVRACRLRRCTLWPYRMGMRPDTLAKHDARKGHLSV